VWDDASLARGRRAARSPRPAVLDMVAHGSQSKARLTIILVVVAFAVLAGALYWTRDAPSGGSRLVNVDFDVVNGELGDVQAEVRIDERAAETTTAACSATAPGKPHVCRVRLPLTPGRHLISVRTLTTRGWTTWSEPTALENQ
jgi:hypothetical protein